jgi:hypothetical protein
MAKSALDDRRFDKRVAPRRVFTGDLDAAEWDAHLDGLPDDADKCGPVTASMEPEVRRKRAAPAAPETVAAPENVAAPESPEPEAAPAFSAPESSFGGTPEPAPQTPAFGGEPTADSPVSEDTGAPDAGGDEPQY